MAGEKTARHLHVRRRRLIRATAVASLAAADLVRTIDLGFAFGDACVAVDGYPIRIFPPSGILQLVAYDAIAAEAAAAKAPSTVPR